MLTKPASNIHLKKARENYRLYQKLMAEDEFYGWAVTLLFYTALHLVQIYFVENATTGFDIPGTHEERSRAIFLKLNSIYRDYESLQLRSQWERYDTNRPEPTKELVQKYHDELFTRILSELAKLDVTL